MLLRKRMLFAGAALWLLSVAVPSARAQFVQQGGTLVGTGSSGKGTSAFAAIPCNLNFTPVCPPEEGFSVAISGDGNTAVWGAPGDSQNNGAAWVFTRSNGTWSQQGGKLVGSGANGPADQGYAVAISGDGNTIIVGGPGDDTVCSLGSGSGCFGIGAVWVFTRSGGAWTQQGSKLVGTGYAVKPTASSDQGVYIYAQDSYVGQGVAVALSADGNTALVGGPGDGAVVSSGAAWVFSRSNGVWTQQGGKLVTRDQIDLPLTYQNGNGIQLAAQGAGVGSSVAISGDGNTAIVGGPDDAVAVNGGLAERGAAFVFTRSNGVWTQQGSKLVGTGDGFQPVPPGNFLAGVFDSLQGNWVALSADGNTALVVGGQDGYGGGAQTWVFTRSNGAWAQHGSSLPGASGPASLSTDGNTALLGNSLYTRNNGPWTQAGSIPQSGASALSGDGNTAILGYPYSDDVGGAEVFARGAANAPFATQASPGGGSATSQTFVFTFLDNGGYQNLTVVDALINSSLDGRHACYVAFVPSGANSGSVFLVDDAGDAGGPYQGMVLPGSGTVQNSQCTIAGSGSSVSGSGYTLTLTLNVTFAAGFAGNRIVYLAAADASGNSGWQALGTWQVPGATTFPSPAGVTPARGAGPAYLFRFTFTDTKGYQDLGVVNMLINNFLDGRQACYLAYSQPLNVLYLENDAGSGLSAGVTPGGSGAVSNSQCFLYASEATASGSGNTLTLTLSIIFTTGAFDGNRVIYAAARDSAGANNSGWQAMGTWQVQ